MYFIRSLFQNYDLFLNRSHYSCIKIVVIPKQDEQQPPVLIGLSWIKLDNRSLSGRTRSYVAWNIQFTGASLFWNAKSWLFSLFQQAFKKKLDQLYTSRSVRSKLVPTAKVSNSMTVTFTGLDKSEVDDAIARLTADLQAKLSKDDWTSSPLKAGIPSLSAQQVRELNFRHRLILVISFGSLQKFCVKVRNIIYSGWNLTRDDFCFQWQDK